MFKNFKNKLRFYINREGFDFMNEEIDPMEYHAPFIKMGKIFGAIESKNKSLRYIMPVGNFVAATMGGSMLAIALVHYIKIRDIKCITECSSYLLMMGYQILMMACIFRGKNNYKKLLETLMDDFRYISTQKKDYRKKFFENHELTFKASFGVVSLCVFTGGGMALCICIAFVISVITKDTGTSKPLPFPFWLWDFDLGSSPTYEVCLVLSCIFTFYYGTLYAFMLQSHVVWIRIITTKADLICWNLEDLLADINPANNLEQRKHNDEVIKHRMKEIIEMHQTMLDAMEGYASVFKKTLLYEQMIASPIICMTAYCFAEKFDQGEVEFLLLFLCIGSIEVTFVPNFLCTHLLEKVQSVADACWDTPFWNAGPVVTHYLVLMMQRSLRSLPMVAHGFADISLETYANMMTRAYSCFNMLRQIDVDFS